MGNHHEPFRSLAPVEWADVPQDDLETFLHDVFAEAQTVIDSVPSPNSPASTATPPSSSTKGRARAKTDSDVVNGPPSIPGRPSQTPAGAEQSRRLQQEWKEVKVNPRENPLDVKVYKLGSKDGRGAWFARRSVHEGLTFDQWKAGLDREFIETMEVQEGPGSGSIRGIGADRRVEDHVVQNAGHAQVFQLSAQFPGPTSPRDFITLLLTSDFSHAAPDQPHPLRQYMIVSKPCVHPECPPRQGIIRGQYESVELIREVPLEYPASKRSHSSADLMSDKNATPTISKSPIADLADRPPTAIEWLMVTRSDPGGSVPRFMIEKGTPPGIVNDAGKFLNWATCKTTDDSQPQGDKEKVASSDVKTPAIPELAGDSRQPSVQRQADQQKVEGGAWSSNGLYGMITGAFGAASSAVSDGLRWQFSNPEDMPNGSDSTSPAAGEAEGDTSPSETSSIRSFASALEKSLTNEKGAESAQGSSETKSQENQPQLKELRRLEERRRKLDEKAVKMMERMERQRQGDKQKDAAAMAKVREKHEKEVAKQEAKYQRELRRIEEKREQEERKAEERKKKTADREEKSKLVLELEKARAEKDMALKQVEMLKNQVGELQAQNTMLTTKMGKLGGITRTDTGSSSSSKMAKST